MSTTPFALQLAHQYNLKKLLGPVQTLNFSWANLIRIKADPNYLDQLKWFRRRS